MLITCVCSAELSGTACSTHDRDGRVIKYDEHNIVAKDPMVPSNMKVQWGDAILATKSQQRAMHKFGTRGDMVQM